VFEGEFKGEQLQWQFSERLWCTTITAIAAITAITINTATTTATSINKGMLSRQMRELQ